MLKHWKATKTVQLTSISVSTKDEKEAGTIHLSKYVVYTRGAQSHKLVSKCRDDENQMSKIANLPKTAIDSANDIDILAFQNFI